MFAVVVGTAGAGSGVAEESGIVAVGITVVFVAMTLFVVCGSTVLEGEEILC